MRDLSVVIVSHNARGFLRAALRSVLEHAGPLDVEVIVVDNGTDGARDLVAREFPAVRVLSCPNRGFAHANNVALRTVESRYVLFLNPDTEILGGRLNDLVALLDARPEVGLASVSQVRPNGTMWATIRRYPSPLRTLAEAFGAGRLRLGAGWLGEREPRRAAYRHETSCDWVAGSFMLVRWEAIESAGWLDERFFLYSEETDFCLRIRMAGWDVRHIPAMTVLHHEATKEASARSEAQIVFARLQYAAKHFSRPRQALFRLALLTRYSLRAPVHACRARGDEQLAAATAGFRTALGRSGSPFAEPPATALPPSSAEPARPRPVAEG
jgi:N-acetylglucosaminyl-diphospho-decaprenol L-rhamnosyltransferase